MWNYKLREYSVSHCRTAENGTTNTVHDLAQNKKFWKEQMSPTLLQMRQST